MRDWFVARLTPLARRLGGIPPNVISLASLVTGCAAGLAFWHGHRAPVLYAVGGGLVAASGVLDGLDGVVARLHGRSSALGDFLDHVFDRVVNVAVLLGLALSPHASLALGLGATVAVLLNSYLGTQIHASFGRRDYTGLGKAELFVALVLLSLLLALGPDIELHLFGWEISPVDAFFILVGVLAVQAMVHRVRLAARLARGSGR
jgi:phosphatidylglycerophosphate synthase